MPLIFLVFVFLLGGGSRSDIQPLPLLRGISFILAIWAGLSLSRGDWRRIRVPFALLAFLSLWIALQLVPLPAVIWQSLPERDTIVAIDRLLGQPDLWRPLSLTPSQTWNSLLAMTVPVAAILLAAQLTVEKARQVLLAIVAIAMVSAFLGFVQILTGAASPAFLYRITNTESMVGLFANRNHHGVFQACASLIAAMVLRDELMRKRQSRPAQLMLLMTILLSTAMTLFIGSRAGLAAGFCTFAVGYMMVASAFRVKVADPEREHSRLAHAGRPKSLTIKTRGSNILLYAPVILLGGLFAAAVWFSTRVTSLSRIADQSVVEDMRVRTWPIVQMMAEKFWVLGSGFGSFPDTYKIFEPDALLQPAYFNHAHNDWVELIITGGVPFVLILLAAAIWTIRKLANQGIRNLVKGHRGDGRLLLWVVLGLFAVASLFDYPLRVPSLQAMMIFLIVITCCPKPAGALRE